MFNYLPILLDIVEDDISGGIGGGKHELLEEELSRWTQNYIDVNRSDITANIVFISKEHIICYFV